MEYESIHGFPVRKVFVLPEAAVQGTSPSHMQMVCSGVLPLASRRVGSALALAAAQGELGTGDTFNDGIIGILMGVSLDFMGVEWILMRI